ncbi:DUF2163 domain-containing protein [Rhizobium oryzicola]|uniref:DUF2163 domain-containing protein n=1 Tax=Rhizobium oryzicola TaxID=1232668 RepID=A0ABT8SU42_9HYPH|nr:DUF2163 domain-containing protein [Rhizobium oryzicola]MDO1581568.1 DUF2163 domain-containing protein [Rhizobium oryzicola]
MIELPEALAAHLAGDATTTCRAWRVTRRDGVVLGFTDHDGDLTMDGTLCRAASGFSASDEEAATGIAASSSDVAGGFSSDVIAEEDLAAGHFDGARVELFLVNWVDPSQCVLLAVREVGEVTRSGGQFKAELRSLANRLDQPQGRLFNRRCDAALGDARCGVDLAGFTGQGAILAMVDRSHLTVSGIASFAAGFFDQGSLRLASGERAEIEAHTVLVDGTVQLSLWLPMERDVAGGEAVTVIAGCDKRFSTCKSRFNNHLNFRGFPHVPGSDFAYSYVDGERAHDGGVLFS